jgi:hypothetical protein
MLIVNPIYDVAFKQIMENNSVAKFVIGTILNCEVLELVPSITERVQEDSATRKPTLFRMDFAATIKPAGAAQKRVIIEMQKAKLLGDVMRFRRYLGKEYATSELPIISIYILGFNLSLDSPAFVARPDYWDLRTGIKLLGKDFFVENLTHNAYFIQTHRISRSFQTKLDRLLSVFEQANFVGYTETTKLLDLSEDDLEQKYPELKELVNILRKAAADKDTLQKLDREQEYLEAMDEMFGKKDTELRQTKEKLEESTQKLGESNQKLKESTQKLEEFTQKLEESAQRNLESAKEMKLDGLPVEKIAKFTGLSIAEIEAL